MSFTTLLPPTFKNDVSRWLSADCPTTDIGGYVVGEKLEKALLFCKSSGVIAGIPFAQAVFDEMDLDVEWLYSEGDEVEASSAEKVIIAIVSGKCRNILLAERTALNILSRASGVATATKKSVDIAKSNKWHGWVAGTRKTTPGFKAVEKYALQVGGGATHRQDLSQMVMLKDNHIWSTGSITNAVSKARAMAGFSMKIEVETKSMEEALEAAEAGADIVMLDNFVAKDLHIVADVVKGKHPNIIIEASGGITETTMHEYMGPCVDVISRGNLTQGYPCLDFSLKIDPQSDKL